jgi:chaperonin GroES
MMEIGELLPIDDRIIVRPHKAKEKTEGGIYLPPEVIGQNQETVQSGDVVAVGPGRFNAQGEYEAMMDICIGDIVYYPRHMGWLFMLEEDGQETEYRFFGAHDVFGRKKREDE